MVHSDLGTEVQIIGRLRRPLGTLLTVEGETVGDGYVRAKADTGETLFRAERVDGAALDEPVVVRLVYLSFLHPDDEPPPSTRMVLRGYETGRMRGIPKGALDHLDRRAAVPATQSWHFAVHFVATEEIEREPAGDGTDEPQAAE